MRKLPDHETANVFTANQLLRSLLFLRRSISVHEVPSSEPSTAQLLRWPELEPPLNVRIVECVGSILRALKSQEIHWPGSFFEPKDERRL
jgi:hypothetical protein